MASEICEKIHMLSVEEINIQHRRERKELQAKIQALKKNAPKSDKKKRKEVMEEVASLEKELEERHKNELQSAESRKKDSVNKNNDEECVEEETHQQPRISKAQKRRDKKEQEAREREIEIRATLNSADVLDAPKAVELRQVLAKLKERQLALHYIPSDGDCLYNAIRHQLQQKNDEHVWSVPELRNKTADYILECKDTLLCYMTNSETGNVLTDDEFISYCEKVRNTAAWGGQVELKALSSILKRPIEVIQAVGPSSILGSDEFPVKTILTITYHRHMYQLGEHYNSTMEGNHNTDELEF